MPPRIASLLDALPIVASTADRNLLFPAPDTNQRVHNLQTAAIERWTGSAWVTDFGGTGGGGSLPRFLEFRMVPEGHGAALNNGDPIDFPTGIGRASPNVAWTGVNTFTYLQGNTPVSLQYVFIDGRPCFKVAVGANNAHTSPVFRPGAMTGRFPLDFFGPSFGNLVAAISPAQKALIAQPMSCSIMAWMRKVSSGDGSSSRMFMGFADNTVVYSSNPVPRVGIVGNGAGGYRYGSVNCPDGLAGGANGDTDIDANPIQPTDLVAPGTNWWHTRIKIVPATTDTPAAIGCYHNGTLVATFSTSTNWPRGGQGTTHDYTRIEACLRCWDNVPGLILNDWRVWVEDDLTL